MGLTLVWTEGEGRVDARIGDGLDLGVEDVEGCVQPWLCRVCSPLKTTVGVGTRRLRLVSLEMGQLGPTSTGCRGCGAAPPGSTL